MSEKVTTPLSFPVVESTVTNDAVLLIDEQGSPKRIPPTYLLPIRRLVSDRQGAAILQGCNALVIAYSQSDISKYIIYVGIGSKGNSVSEFPQRIVLASNGLSLGDCNFIGTSNVNGADDVVQYVLQLKWPS